MIMVYFALILIAGVLTLAIRDKIRWRKGIR
jgi:hypothetical protein